jgi:hypothetical protein
MCSRLLSCLVFSAALIPGPVLAQTAGTSPGQKSSAANQNHTKLVSAQSVPEKVKEKLKNQGFTDVEVVPGSLLVSAKDKDGDPVTMIIGPHSMTVFTMTSAQSGSTVGSGASGDSTK